MPKNVATSYASFKFPEVDFVSNPSSRVSIN